jgi:hypothetical protein
LVTGDPLTDRMSSIESMAITSVVSPRFLSAVIKRPIASCTRWKPVEYLLCSAERLVTITLFAVMLLPLMECPLSTEIAKKACARGSRRPLSPESNQAAQPGAERSRVTL